MLTGADFDLDLTGGGRLQKPPTSVKLGNVSGFVLEITIGGQQDHLAPGETNVFPTNGATTVHVHPVSIAVTAG